MLAHDIYILRHGETAWNAEGRLQGWLDSPLTARGREQAKTQGRILRGLRLPADTRFRVSPLGRARETARIALAGLAPAPALDARLSEVGLGAWQGLTHTEIARRWPGQAVGGLMFKFTAPGGETLDALEARLATVLAEIDGPTVLVTHGVASAVLRSLALGLDAAALEALSDGQGVVHHVGPAGHAIHASGQPLAENGAAGL